MSKPILSLKDKRVLKLKDSHAILCYSKGENKFKFFHVDNLPEKWLGWQYLKAVPAAQSGLTISESIYQMNKELERVKITRRRKTV